MSLLPVWRRAPTLFDGLPEAELSALVARLERRYFTAGTVVIAEGDQRYEIYLVQSGMADVLLTDREGREHQINRIGPGGTLGEMSLVSGQPASATVRAFTDLEMLVMGEREFHAAASASPRIYQNLGAILSQKLVRSDRRAFGTTGGEVISIIDEGGPPGLAYAVAASVAWHTHKPTVLVTTVEPGSDLGGGVSMLGWPSAVSADPVDAAHLVAAPISSGHDLLVMVEELRERFTYVVVYTPRLPVEATQSIQLVRAEDFSRPPRNGRHLILRGWTTQHRIARPWIDLDVPVPPLAQTDLEMLRRGQLAAATPAGRAIGWVARHIAHLKVGLALGGGGAKGYAHVGVLSMLQQCGVPIDYLAGTSVGAMVAGLYALGNPPAAIADILDGAGAHLFRLTVPRRSLLSDNRLRQYLRSIAGEQRIEDLSMPLAMVAADLATGREVVFRRGLLWAAALASVAIPGVFPAQVVAPYILVDGGVVNPVPSVVAAEMGADIVIGIRLRNAATLARTEAESRPSKGAGPSVLEVISRAIDIMQGHIAPDGQTGTTVIIEPRFEGSPGWGLRRFSQGRQYVTLGAAAVESAQPRLAAVLPWVG